MNKLPPTLIKAIFNEDNGIFKSQGHLTACKACGKMMYHNMSGSSKDLCRIELNRGEGCGSRMIFLCRSCLTIIQNERAHGPNYPSASEDKSISMWKFVDAANKGDIVKMRLLLKKGADVNSCPERHNPVLIEATKRGDFDVVIFLLENEADVNLQDKYGQTALMFASGHGNDEIVKLLLEKGADVNWKTNRSIRSGSFQCPGWTALMVASVSNHTNIIKILLENGADVNKNNNHGQTTLMLASKYGANDEIVKLLLAKEAKVELKDTYGKTALNFALENGHKTIVDILNG